MNPWIQVAITLVVALISFVLGWITNKKLADRIFLRNEIYSPLYKEVRTMHANVLDFKKCNQRRSGAPDYSASPPADKVPGNIRHSLVDSGQYLMLPEGLKKELDEYYLKCLNEWDPLLDMWDVVRDFQAGKLVEIQVVDGGRGCIKKYSNGHKEKQFSLIDKKDYQKYRGIEKLPESEVKASLASLQQCLQKRGEQLLQQLAQRIREPNPLKSLRSLKS